MVSAGALVLSILNAWVQFSSNRVKLKVIPKFGYYDEEVRKWAVSAFPFLDMMNAINQNQHRLGIEVINLSSFAVTIRQVGFGKFKLLKDSIGIPTPIIMEKEKCWPPRLESRESVLLMLNTGVNIPIDELDKNCAHVETECGHIVYGESHGFDAYVELLKKQKNSK